MLRIGAGLDDAATLTPTRGAGRLPALRVSASGSRAFIRPPCAQWRRTRFASRATPNRSLRRRTNARFPDRRHLRPRGGAPDLRGCRARPPAPPEPRLVVDIGGGSTEFIIGRGLDPQMLESLKIGCVGMSQRFFADGTLTAAAFDEAETAARVEIEAIARDFTRGRWKDAFASSGTALALAEILEQNGMSSGGITPAGLARFAIG